ncbi:hypothetical protein L1049_003508 [Liquidambar formosana]|uniref:Uncharacterized protein n=1 Tax=Liquidambar formosana TaxID=63359 RepID=A0AAP0N2T6_LIQFO
MAQELKFQQRWDFRRRDSDLDSSSDDSKSSSSDEPAFKKHKLVSSLDSPENDETSDTPRFQQNGKDDAGTGGHSNSGKAKKKKIGSSKKDSLVKNAMEREPFRKVSRKKSKTRAYEPASLNDTKIFMESLLEELKVTRENLFIQMREEMQKLIADDTITQAARREGSCGQGAVQVQHQSNFESGMKLMADNSIRQANKERRVLWTGDCPSGA